MSDYCRNGSRSLRKRPVAFFEQRPEGSRNQRRKPGGFLRTASERQQELENVGNVALVRGSGGVLPVLTSQWDQGK
jgi:hypothetical protein